MTMRLRILRACLAGSLAWPCAAGERSAQSRAEDDAGSEAAPASSPADPIQLIAAGRSFLNLSVDALIAGGTSTARDVGGLASGGHDPIQRGFTVQGVEIVFEGAVDPYFRGQSNISLQIDAEGETTVELEEIFLTTAALPQNLQVKAGSYLTEFGRLNPQHAHFWDFVDQPLVNGRFFGPDGLRNAGARLSWLVPAPFYSEVSLSVQNSHGETAESFRSVEGEERSGRPIQDRPLRTARDLLYAPRYAASIDLTDQQTLLAGASAALGPNGTGLDSSTRIVGADLFWKWKPTRAQAGFPFVKAQAEAMWRRYEAGRAEIDADEDGETDSVLPAETLRDRGAYGQLLWGFRRGWVAGLRGEAVSGNEGAFAPDPARQSRWRVSPNITWFPTEYSKIRLQLNRDRREVEGNDTSVWLQLEFLLGAHAAHKF